MIKRISVAYAIGFSDSLRYDSWSAYNDAAKWSFNPESRRRLIASYLGGWKEGFALKEAVVKELLSRHFGPDTTSVAMAPFIGE